MNRRVEQALASDNPEDRKRAIRALAKGPADEDVLRRLVAIYKTDPDPEVRQIALAAGKRLRRQSQSAASPTRQTQSMMAAVNTPVRTGRNAEALLSDAVDAIVMADYQRAEELVRQAYEVDPSIIDSDKNCKIISSALRLPVRDALYEIGVDPAVLGGKRKRRKRDTFDLTILDALLYCAGYGAFFAVVTFVIYLLIAAVSFGLSLPVVLPGLVAAGLSFLSAALGWLISNYIVHFIATLVFSGNGTFAGLLREVTLPALGYTIVTYGVQFAVVLAVPGALDEIATQGEFSAATINSLADTGSFLLFLPLIVPVVAAFHYAYLIGVAYEFGFTGGCQTLMFMVLFIPCAICAAYFVSLSLDVGSLMVQ